jgi:formate hydrogenlyase subunit 3/multisubunit Na+/H+ antiporter MnhD subunit
VFLAKAAVELGGWRMVLLLADLLVSTALNVGYLLRTVLTLYRPAEEPEAEPASKTKDAPFAFAMGVLIVLNLGLGVFASTVMNWIQQGIAMFA